MNLYKQRLKSTEERFWEKVDKSNDCWEWTAGKDRDGYGVFALNNYPCQAHRAVLILDGVDIPSGMVVCHTCDNPSCVRPDHLFIGTVQDNLNDMVSKGRSMVGERHHNAKLTENDVRFIKIFKGCITGRRMAEIFGVHEGRIYNIHAGRDWAHVKGQ